MSPVVGREPELSAVRVLLDDVSEGPAVLVLAGVAGIGKTTAWCAGVDEALARGFAVLLTRPTASDVHLSYAGLADLLADVPPPDFELLPEPQWRALDAALLRGAADDPAPDPRAVAAGFLSILDTLATSRPVLLALDDIQWLDAPSLRAVEFAVRRCRGPIAVLAARRDGEPGSAVAELRPRASERARMITLGPLEFAELRQVIRQHTGHSVARNALTRIAELSGGNPFFAIELGRGLESSEPASIALPPTLQAAVQERLDRLEEPVIEVLRIVAMLGSPRSGLVAGALGSSDSLALLQTAEAAGVVELAANGGVRFSHPLLAAGITAAIPAGQRRELHRRLSEVVDDPEERARHLAHAAIGPDPETVRALDSAAEQARRRGAPSAAAELLELAIGLGADDGSRHVQAAQDLFDAGDPVRARELLDAALTLLYRGLRRAEALGRLGVIRFESDADPSATQLLEQAIEEAGTAEPGLRSSIRTDLAFMYFVGGRIPEALGQAATAIREAEHASDPGLLAESLAGQVITRFLSGGGTEEALLVRSLQLEVPGRRTAVRRWPSTVAAQVFRWTHRLSEAHAAFMDLRRRCIERGAESDLWFVSLGAIPAACWAGNVGAAKDLVRDTLERAGIVESGHALGMARLFEAQYLAWVGDVERAREAGAEAEKLLGSGGVATIGLEVPAALGMAELSLGDYEAAARHLAPAAASALAMGFAEPAAAQFLPDAAEVLIALGRLDEAEPLITLLEGSGQRLDRAWARATGARCRGLLLAARGKLDEATAAYDQALHAHKDISQLRYDRARTLLVRAANQRRTNQRRAALASLSEAEALFEGVGALRWAQRAREEVGRLGLRPTAGEALTPTEERVAHLAASGMTTRSVAAVLSMSPKTVEVHLGRIYRKLEIRSRAELGARLAGPEPTSDS